MAASYSGWLWCFAPIKGISWRPASSFIPTTNRGHLAFRKEHTIGFCLMERKHDLAR
uniref:Uncharacterized protein n=1 Tax=Setaria italica TaxID=4555 RepID=K3Z0D6_SETIT